MTVFDSKRPIDDFVFIDTETTGLYHGEHKVLELSYAVGDSEPITILCNVFMSAIYDADPKALEINGYDKFLERTQPRVNRLYLWSDDEWERHYSDMDVFQEAIRGKTWVGANPSFDVAMLEHIISPLQHHHRLFDIQAYAAGVWQTDSIPSFFDICNILGAEGRTITQADHTSRNDVLATRDAFYILTDRI